MLTVDTGWRDSERVIEVALETILPGGRGVWVPIDHGASAYPERGLSPILETLQSIIEGGADAIVAQKGVVSWAHGVGITNIPMLAHLSLSTLHAGRESTNKVLVGSVSEAIDRGAHGVSAQVNLGDEMEARMVEALGHVTTDAYSLGVPVLGMIYPRGPNLVPIPGDRTGGVAHAVRLAFEIGCSVVKVPLVQGESAGIVAAAPIPVLFAGGAADGGFDSFLGELEAAMSHGAAGVCIGRRIFASNDVAGRLGAIRSVVHEGLSATDAATRFA